MTTAVVRRPSTAVGRPLKVLVPLIQQDIENGHRAGMAYYADAGDKLIEAKPQLAHRQWVRWLTTNFEISERHARVWMRLATLRKQSEGENGFGESALPKSLNEMEGRTEWARARRDAERPFRETLRDIVPDLFTVEKQTRDGEVRLHRDLAEELIDLGYKALAMRLHPDRGGSKDAMARLNRVRDELKGIATTRRFV